MVDVDLYIKHNSFDRIKEILSEKVISCQVENPFFTIIIPTYKRYDTLRATVLSAVNQVGKIYDYEIIIINNDPESRNGITRDIIGEVQSDKISYYVNEQNLGMYGNWNRAIELARGKYIVMLHDDDIMSPYYLASLQKVIKYNNEPGIIGVANVKFDSSRMPSFKRPEKLVCKRVSKRSFFFNRYIGIVGMAFKKELAIKLGGYTEEYYPNADSVFIYQGLLCSEVLLVDNILAGYRVEVNASLNEDTMKKIIITTEYTRRSIAEHELWAKIWMKYFGKEYLYKYICGANGYWRMRIKAVEIFDKLSMKDEKINMQKLKLMECILRIEKKIPDRCRIIVKRKL